MQNNNLKDLTKGNPYRIIAEFALPIFLSQLFQQLYNTADSLIVGQSLGTNALAAVSSSGNLIFLLVSFFEGMFIGAGVVISNYFGAGNREKVSRAVHTTVTFGLVSGILLTVIGMVFTPTFLSWMNTDRAVMPDAVEYFRYYFAGALALVMYNVFRGIMTAAGDSKHPLYYLIFSSVMNVALDLLFVSVFRWGVWSAAFATVISQFASVVLCAVRLIKHGGDITVNVRKLRIHRDMLYKIIKYGFPSGVQNSVIGFANVIVQSQINTFGKIATAAYGSQSKIEGFAFLPIISFNTAITTFISQNLGAKEYERAKKGARFGILAAVFIAEIIGVVYFFSAERLFSLFDKSEEVISLGTQQAHIICFFYCLLAFSHSVAAVCRGAGKAFVPMFVMLSIWCVVRITYIFIVMRLTHNIRFIFWAYPITWSISSVIYFLYYRFSDWVHGFDSPKTS